VWFTERHANRIGRITPTGQVTEFQLPAPWKQPAPILTGPDGNLWFTERAVGRVGRMTPSGEYTEFPLPYDRGFHNINQITVGSDGNLWFALEKAIASVVSRWTVS
jgi:virginiamycin B lyase